MPEIAVLFDVENTLIKEKKNVSDYYFEAIRFVYGLSIDDINLADYEGLTVQETLIEILQKQGLKKEEILEKHEQFLEELPYAHYNVAGHDSAVLVDGAKTILNNLKDNNRYVIGAASGQLERILSNMFDRVNMKYDNYFKFGAYGNVSENMSKILDSAMAKAGKEYGIDKHGIYFVSNVKNHVHAAHALGIRAVGVITDPFSEKDLKNLGVIHIAKNLKDCERFIK
ncbi:MAG: HAD hydrolase-like protein [Candidatus Micrarchaeaceae archaeon]|jgi:phosphoglycolate phosphatase-like HAD superfamily hydrolase